MSATRRNLTPLLPCLLLMAAGLPACLADPGGSHGGLGDCADGDPDCRDRCVEGDVDCPPPDDRCPDGSADCPPPPCADGDVDCCPDGSTDCPPPDPRIACGPHLDVACPRGTFCRYEPGVCGGGGGGGGGCDSDGDGTIDPDGEPPPDGSADGDDGSRTPPDGTDPAAGEPGDDGTDPADGEPSDGSDPGDDTDPRVPPELTGWCTPIPDACPEYYSPVCGCDGVTYENDCFADAAGASILHDGECRTTDECSPFEARGVGPCDLFLGWAWNGRFCEGLSGCECEGADCDRLYRDGRECELDHSRCDGGGGGECGGPLDVVCPPDMFCHLPPDALCGEAGITGRCEPRPDACPDIYAPVCACDGVTYGNECEAHAAGVSVLSSGECDATRDCRDTGCRDGDYCTMCWGSYACIPRGAVC